MIRGHTKVVGVGLGVLLATAGCVAPNPQPKAQGLVVGPEDPRTSQIVELPPKEAARACLATARELDRNGKIEEAIPLYEKARHLDPSQHDPIARRLAVLYDRTGQFTKAMEEYEAALRRSPRDADLFNDLGYSFYSRGEWAAAEEQLRKALDVDPEHKRAWTNLGMTLAQLGRAQESFEAFCRAVPPPQAHCNLAFLLAARGQKEEAQSEYRKALELEPDLRLARAALDKLSDKLRLPETDRTAEESEPRAWASEHVPSADNKAEPRCNEPLPELPPVEADPNEPADDDPTCEEECSEEKPASTPAPPTQSEWRPKHYQIY